MFAPQHAHRTGTRKKGLRERVAREDDGGGAAGVPELDAGFFMVKAQPSQRAIRLGGVHDLGVGQLRQRPTVRRVQVPEGSRGIVEMHPIGTLGGNQTEAAHPYITTHPEMRDRKRGSGG